MRTTTWRQVGAGAVMLALVAAGASAAAADRALGWFRAGGGALARELENGARRGLRLAAVSDGLPCSVGVLQAPAMSGAAVEYRVVADRDLAGALDGLVGQGFMPVASTRTFGARHEVAFERQTPPRPAAAWRLVEFEKLEDLPAAVSAAAADGYRATRLVRPAFRSWPGLSERGLLLAVKAADAPARESRVVFATKKNVEDMAAEVASVTKTGWEFDLLFSNTRDGSGTGRRERATVVLSKPRTGTVPPAPVTIERRSSFGMVGDEVVGAAAYWDEYLFATIDRDRRQAWASPISIGAGDADCGPLGLGFRFDAPRDQTSDIVALVAKPSPTGGFELVVVTNQRLGF
ncbi:MAG: hypothetical protein IT181_15735 [Acidobacteria bacterium]|nr:hypothetical protein [Acidobacteriota bacterium]